MSAAAGAASLFVDLATIGALGAVLLVARRALRAPGVYGRRRGQLTDWWGHAIWACTGVAMFLWVVAFA